MHLRNCLQIATYGACNIHGMRRINGRTVSNRLHEHGIRLRRYTDPCVDQRLTFCGDSDMAWAGITARRRTLLVIIDEHCYGVRYRDEILQQHVIPFIRTQRHVIRFQQDNTRLHVERVVMEFLAQHNINVL
jgi:hypothetical protein